MNNDLFDLINMQVLFGRKRPKQSVSTKFAEEVLDLEISLDMKCDLPKVKRLMELYSRAIEYYAPLQDPKYLHYQDRLHTLLTRSDVLSLLDGASAKPQKLSLIHI